MKPPLYVHIPYCLKKCGYCDFFSKPLGRVPAEYVKAAARQIEFLAREFFVDEWKSVYIGGGTPSLLETEGLEFLCKAIKAAAPIASGAEWTIEMNPGTMSRELLEAARAGGINRLSVGIQCKRDKVLRAVGRSATEAQIEEAAALAKNFWKLPWSADLMAGLPFQTKEDLERDIEFAADMGAKHVSLYSLTLEEGTPLERKIARGELPYDEEAAEDLWLHGRDILEERGFEQYEVSNFAKPGFESRHNAAYWAQESYLGAGAGATGTIYGNPTGIRYTNVLDAAAYMDYWNGERPQAQKAAPLEALQAQKAAVERLDMDTQEFEYLMTNLRTKRGASADEYKARYGKDLLARLGLSKAKDAGANSKGSADQKAAAARWVQKIERDGKIFCAMTREGLLFLNRFLEEL